MILKRSDNKLNILNNKIAQTVFRHNMLNHLNQNQTNLFVLLPGVKASVRQCNPKIGVNTIQFSALALNNYGYIVPGDDRMKIRSDVDKDMTADTGNGNKFMRTVTSSNMFSEVLNK